MCLSFVSKSHYTAAAMAGKVAEELGAGYGTPSIVSEVGLLGQIMPIHESSEAY